MKIWFGFQVAVGNIWEVGRQQEVKLEAGFFVQGSVHCAQLGIRTRLADEAMVSKTRFAAATNHWHSNKEIQESRIKTLDVFIFWFFSSGRFQSLNLNFQKAATKKSLHKSGLVQRLLAQTVEWNLGNWELKYSDFQYKIKVDQSISHGSIRSSYF